MFKYIKTIGAHSGAPEIEYLPVDSSTRIVKSSLCQIKDGYLVSEYVVGKSTFIPLEGKEEYDGKKKIKCIRILPGMLIECDFYGD